MKRILLLFVFSTLLIPSAWCSDIDRTLTEMDAFWNKVKTFSARFVQTKKIVLFEDEITSRGVFRYKNPGIMIWRYGPPENTTLIISPGSITILFSDLNKAKVIEFGGTAQKPDEAAVSIGIGGGMKKLAETFEVGVIIDKGLFRLTLIPREKKEGMSFEKVEIVMDREYLPLTTKIYEFHGDTTTITFSDQRINPTMSEDDFSLDLPRGTEIERITLSQ